MLYMFQNGMLFSRTEQNFMLVFVYTRQNVGDRQFIYLEICSVSGPSKMTIRMFESNKIDYGCRARTLLLYKLICDLL
jgi:hypothetical protein